MTPGERREQIVSIVRQRGRAAVDDLAAAFKVSPETIRRDLTVLARLGKVQKFHGGATLPLATGEGPFRARMSENAAQKARIARKAASLISPGETVFIDTGSTTVYFAEELAGISGLTVVTNSAEVARVMDSAGNGARVYLLGGEYNRSNRQTLGPMVIEQIRQFRAHHAVLTLGALDVRSGVMDFNNAEAQIARAMIGQAEQVTILCVSAKFGRIASFEVCPLSRVDALVSDATPQGGLKAALREAGAEIHVAD